MHENKIQKDEAREQGNDKEVSIIPTDSIFKYFKEHIKIPENNRILFSGQFGTGKTYFLNKFFNEHQEEYFLVHLHPSQYQIASNEKIIDYIKMDILLSILEQTKQKLKLLSPVACKKWLESGWGSIALSLGKPIPIVGNYLGSVNETLQKLGTITEDSIKKQLQEVEKKKVLIIDDMDRLDPEHIFRICNVFSALVGEDEEGTIAKKLGFHTVIFVADYSNLESIFQHKYGAGTRSEGYFNKFYSINIFEHNPKENIRKWIQDAFQKEVIERSKKNETGDEITLILDQWLARFLLENFLRTNNLDLRQILTGLNYETPAMQQYYHPDNIRYNEEGGNKVKIKNTITFLIETIGSREKLIEAIEKSLTGGAALCVFKNQSDNQNILALKKSVKTIFVMIELSEQEMAALGSLNNELNRLMGIVFNDGEIRSRDNNDILNAFKEVLILYIKRVHEPIR